MLFVQKGLSSRVSKIEHFHFLEFVFLNAPWKRQTAYVDFRYTCLAPKLANVAAAVPVTMATQDTVVGHLCEGDRWAVLLHCWQWLYHQTRQPVQHDNIN